MHRCRSCGRDRDDLRPDRQACLERGAVPKDGLDLAIVSDREAARIGQVRALAQLIDILDPFGGFGGVDEVVAALVDPFERGLRSDVVDPALADSFASRTAGPCWSIATMSSNVYVNSP